MQPSTPVAQLARPAADSPRPLVVRGRGLTKHYGDFVAVDGIDLDVLHGECFGVLGPNGAGKTTTVRMVYGFSPLTAGELTVVGLDLRQHLRQIKSRIGVCQQENNLDQDLTVLHNLLVYARYFGIPAAHARRRALELLSFADLSHKAAARILELSGGLQRRLVVIRALINEPELLILDEPTTGLDPQSRHQLWERLEELKMRGLSILLTTHYMEEAARLCDRLVIMDHGKILIQGSPARLIEQHVGSQVIEVAAPGSGLLDWVRQSGLSHDHLRRRLVVYLRDGESLFAEMKQRYPGLGCTLRPASLEDVFLKLTGRELRE